MRASVRPEAHSAGIGRFRHTKNGGFKEETNSIIATVFAFKSVDLVLRRGVSSKAFPFCLFRVLLRVLVHVFCVVGTSVVCQNWLALVFLVAC